MNYKEVLIKGTKILKLNNIKSFNLDSEILLASSLNLDRTRLLLNLNNKIKKKQKKIFFDLINRRKNNEPIAYILGFKEFWKNKFKINKSALIPRPDTEIVVEETLKEIKKNESKQILDIGTGSGCIILSVLNERKKSFGYGIDVSKKALNLAKSNAKIQHINNRIKFLKSDIDNYYYGKYDLILSNPPYIKLSDLNVLDKDIKCFEPNLALNGGIDGFSKIRKVIKQSSLLIKKKGKLILEIGLNQAIKTEEILKINDFYINRIVKDFSGVNRCIVSTKL
tara:strand:- start:1818 stop:2660 length:843 start_codon:yes stop_codon:yes gene_type:complete